MTKLWELPAAIVPAAHMSCAPCAHEGSDAPGTNVLLELGRSVICTAVASDGPLFVTVTVHETWPPATTGLVSSVLLIARSADVVNGAVDVAELLVPSGSASAAATDALLSSDPVSDESIVTPIVTEPTAPADKLERAQSMDPGEVSTQPGDDVAASNIVPAGRVSLTVTELAVDGPALLTVRSQVVDDPETGAGEGKDLTRERSLDRETAVLSDDVSFPLSGSAWSAETVAEFVSAEASAKSSSMFKLMMKSVEAPAVNAGAEHVMVEPMRVQEGSEPTGSKDVPAGTVSVTRTLLAFDGPAFEMLTVKLAVSPAVAVGEPATLAIARSLS